MQVSNSEREDIIMAVEIGKRRGFGNLIAHLISAWAVVMMEKHGFDEKSALEVGANRTGYPIQMHKDIIGTGEWDESGERYAQPEEQG